MQLGSIIHLITSWQAEGEQSTSRPAIQGLCLVPLDDSL